MRISIYIQFDFLSDILSKILTKSRPGPAFIILENFHNDILCKNKAPREKMRKLQVIEKIKIIVFIKLDNENSTNLCNIRRVWESLV